MKLFSRPHRRKVIGIDIGRSAIKAVQLGKNKDGQITFVAYGHAQLPSTTETDPIIHPALYLPSLTGLLQSPKFGQFSGTHFVISLPARHVHISHSIEPTTFSKVASEQLGINSDQLHTQTFLASDGKTHIGLASLRAALDPHLAALNSFYPVLASEHEASAAARAFNLEATKALLIDFGNSETTLSYFHSSLQASKSLPIGTAKLVAAMALKIPMPEAEAREMLFSYGLQSSAMQIKIREIAKPFIIDLIGNIQKFIAEQKFQPERMLLYGGGACIPAFASYMARHLDHPIEIANPWAATDLYPLKPMPRKIAPQFSVAVGLALLGLN